MADQSSSATLGDRDGDRHHRRRRRVVHLRHCRRRSPSPRATSAIFTVSLTPLPVTATPAGELTVDWATVGQRGQLGRRGPRLRRTAPVRSRLRPGRAAPPLASNSRWPFSTTTLDELQVEQFRVRLSNETGAGARIGGTATATATITDDVNDVPVLSIDDVTAQEDAGIIEFPVTLSLPSALEIIASYATRDGTATAAGSGLHRGVGHGDGRDRRDRPPRSPSTCSTTSPTSRTRPSPSS